MVLDFVESKEYHPKKNDNIDISSSSIEKWYKKNKYLPFVKFTNATEIAVLPQADNTETL